MTDYSQIVADMTASLAEPSVYERTVTPGELRAAADKMLKRGYWPTEASLLALEKYLQGYALWLAGDVGTGKTFFFRAAPVWQPQGRSDRGRAVLNMGQLLGENVESVKRYLADHADDELVIDDIGKEPLFVEYGTRFEILPWIVEERMQVQARTHYTSNYGKKYFDERYGYGLFDRIFTGAYFVEFAGVSRRVLAPRVKYRPPAAPRGAAAPQPGALQPPAPAGSPQSRPGAPRSARSRSDGEGAAPAPKTPPEAPRTADLPPTGAPEAPETPKTPPDGPQEPPGRAPGTGEGEHTPSPAARVYPPSRVSTDAPSPHGPPDDPPEPGREPPGKPRTTKTTKPQKGTK